MSITVQNTDAGLSGKTIVNGEDAQTVTGLKTFDRDPNAPFAVASGSAVVTNLDADKLDGSEGASYVHKTDDCVWTSFTPTWTNLTVGSGTVIAKYLQLGKIVFYKIALTFAANTSISGAVQISFPVTAVSATSNVGQGEAIDTGTGSYSIIARLVSSSNMVLLADNGSSLTNITSTVPFTWTTSDGLLLSGFFEAS